ncbi:MAG: DUF2292 domain-containing protein [Desulfofundulus sp.]
MDMKVSKQIISEVNARPDKIDAVNYGKVTFVIQAGRLVRVEIQDGWVTEQKQETKEK